MPLKIAQILHDSSLPNLYCVTKTAKENPAHSRQSAKLANNFRFCLFNAFYPLHSVFIMKKDTAFGEDLLLIRWLYTQRPDLVELSKSSDNKNANSLKKIGLAALQMLVMVVWANPKAFDGNSLLSGDSKRNAELTSGVVSGATMFNALTNGPILFYAFRYIGLAPAVGISVLLNIIILWWTNQSSTTAANKKHGNKMWSSVGVAAFLAMSTVQSVVAGVGTELMNNQDELSYIQAERLVDQKVSSLKTVREDLKSSEAALDLTCNEGRSLLRQMQEEGSPSFYSTYISVNGGTYDQVIAGELKDENAPCAPAHLMTYRSQIQEAEQALSYIEAQRTKMDNDIELLKQLDEENGSATFIKHFRTTETDGIESYTLRSGTDAIALASENFWKSLTFQPDSQTGEIGISTSFLFFALSVVTSLSAVVLIIAHTCTLDNKMSRNSNVEEAVKHWLESIRRQYAQRPDQDRTEADEKLLALFIDDYYQNGKCDYPVAQAVAKMSQQGVGLRLIKDGNTLIQEIDKAYAEVDKSSFELNEQLSKPESEGALNTSAVKKSLAHLTQGVIRLLSLSDRYAASVSLEGEKAHYRAMKALAGQLREQLDDIKTTLYGNLVRHGVEASTRSDALDNLRSYLVELQGDCAELKELTQEAIKDKLIPLFGDDASITATTLNSQA